MIRRRWPDTFILAAAGAAFLAWAASLFHGTLLGACAATFFGFLLLTLAVLGPASGPCPACGEVLHGLFVRAITRYERCPHCRRYFRVADMKEVPAGHTAKTPQFAVPIGRGEALPSLCCVCGEPATRTQEVVYRSAGRVSHASPLTLATELKVPAPYCAAHEGGVVIVSEDLAPSAPLLRSLGASPRSDHRWVLKVRSYAFYLAALKS